MGRAHFNALGASFPSTDHPQIFAAAVARDVTDPAELVDIVLANTEDQGLLSSNLAPWPPKSALPQRGDGCLVALDDTGRPWVVAWEEAGGLLAGGGGGASNVFIQQTAPTGVTDPYVWFQTNPDGSLNTIWTGP